MKTNNLTITVSVPHLCSITATFVVNLLTLIIVLLYLLNNFNLNINFKKQITFNCVHQKSCFILHIIFKFLQNIGR